MFDGLKEKLGRFQENVEEEAETVEGEADAADAETADAETAGGADADDAEEDLGLAKKAALAATGKTIITESELEEPLERLELELLQGEIGRASCRERVLRLV